MQIKWVPEKHLLWHHLAENTSSQETHQNCITPVQKCKQFHSAAAFVSYTNMIRVNSTLVIVPHKSYPNGKIHSDSSRVRFYSCKE